jgi:exosortase/archaeosortase family protein
VPTDTSLSHRHTQARNFALRGVAWSLGLFGVLRLGWFEAHAVLPLTQFQARMAVRAFGTPTLPIAVTLACSGADALALCTGAILAYPARWRMRATGAAGGIGLILALNTVRIGTLGAVRQSWFEILHVYAWPALLMLAIAGYVFTWMRVADRGIGSRAARGPRLDEHALEPLTPTGPTNPVAGVAVGRPVRPDAATHPSHPFPLSGRFVWWTAAFLAIFTAAAPLYLDSAGVLAVAAFIARGAAAALGVLGVQATASGNTLWTARGALVVTQECISTPLIPVYLAAVVAYSTRWRTRAWALLGIAPLFVGLGIARLLVVALPPALIGSPLFLIHAFYQLLLAVVVVCLAALWRHGAAATAWRRALAGCAVGGVLAYLLAPVCTRAVAASFAAATLVEDPQGAIALLPAFQIGLYIALCTAAFAVFAWRRFVAGLALLGVSQIALFAVLHAAERHGGLTPHVRDVRAWAVAAPLVVVAALVTHGRARR